MTRLKDYLDSDPASIPYAVRDRISKTIDYCGGRPVHRLPHLPVRNSYKGYKVGWLHQWQHLDDCRSVFDALGAQTYVINNTPSGTSINKDAGSTHWPAAWCWTANGCGLRL